MGSRKTGRILRWAREHGLAPHHYGHVCEECRHFHKSYRYGVDNKPTRNYCSKWIKVVEPQSHACSYFSFKRVSSERISKRYRHFCDKRIIIRLSASGYKGMETSKRMLDVCEKIEKLARNSGCKAFPIRLKGSAKKSFNGKRLYIFRREVVITNLNENIVHRIVQEKALGKIVPKDMQVEISARL